MGHGHEVTSRLTNSDQRFGSDTSYLGLQVEAGWSRAGSLTAREALPLTSFSLCFGLKAGTVRVVVLQPRRKSGTCARPGCSCAPGQSLPAHGQRGHQLRCTLVLVSHAAVDGTRALAPPRRGHSAGLQQRLPRA